MQTGGMRVNLSATLTGTTSQSVDVNCRCDASATLKRHDDNFDGGRRGS